MSRIRLILLSLGAVFAVSAMAAASASALSDAYFEQPSKALATEPIEGRVGTAWLQGEIAKLKSIIECTTNKLEGGEIEAAGKSKGKIEYNGCKFYTISEGKKTNQTANCPVKEPIKFSFLDQLFTQTKAGVVADEFKPSAPPVFVEIGVGGSKCTLTVDKEKLKVEGTYAASLGGQAEEDQTEHEIVFNEAGSSVTLGGKPASYTNTVEKVKRTNGKEWYVD